MCPGAIHYIPFTVDVCISCVQDSSEKRIAHIIFIIKMLVKLVFQGQSYISCKLIECPVPI